LNEFGDKIQIIEVGSVVTLNVVVQINENIPLLVLGYLIKDKLGLSIFGTNTELLGLQQRKMNVSEIILHQFTFDANLGAGTYSVAVALTSSGTERQSNFEWRDLALVFEVVNTKHIQFVGSSWLPPVAHVSLSQ
jgi:lipopolysaccharide transport system ATP-binding protein